MFFRGISRNVRELKSFDKMIQIRTTTKQEVKVI